MSRDLERMMAEGLCIQPWLQHGIPGPESINCLMKEIDDQLIQNQQQLEDCVKGLMDLSNNLAPAEQKKTIPAEALDQLAEYHLLDRETCNDPQPDDVTRLLKHVIELIEKNPGCEESVLAQIFQLSSQQGLTLPSIKSSDPNSQSVLSINMAVDDMEHTNELLWNDICRRLRKYYIDQLQKLTFLEPKLQPDRSTGLKRRQQYVESLCSLYPTQDIWSRYRSLRSIQVDKCLSHNYLKGEAKQATRFAQASLQFQYITKHIVQMINEDFELFNSGVFRSNIATFQALDELYLEKLLDHIGSVVSILQEDICNSYPKENKKSHEKELPKSASEFGILGHIRGNLRRQQSKSLDSLIGIGEELQFTDLYALPQNNLDPLSHFITCIMCLEKYMDNLHTAVTWEVSSIKKSKAHKSLKSALKMSGSPSQSQTQFTDPLKKTFSPRSFEGLHPDAIPPPFGATQAMMAEVTASFRVTEKPFESKPRWDWRSRFRALVPDIAKALEIHIREVTDGALIKGQTFMDRHARIDMVNVAPELVGGRLDYPKLIGMGVKTITTELDRFLPLASASSEGTMVVIRSAFIDALVVNLRRWMSATSKLILEIPTEISVSCLYGILSGAAYIRNHLVHYEQTLGLEESNRKTLPLLYKEFCELVDTISRQIIDYHSHLMSTVILQDAESHNWQDTKDFYENERCSFSIQMWNFHLRSLQSDLWGMCPPMLSQSVFVTVLQSSLNTLCQRYTRVKPAYRRTPQFKADITTILLCTSELLFPACSSVSKYLDPSSAQKEYYCIHNSCCSLVAALAIIASPIDVLYRTYKKGFKKRTHFEDEDPKGYMAQWLTWIRPNLFPLGKISYEELQTTSAVYLQLKMLYSQPDRSWSMLLQALLMKDFTLPIMLLTKVSTEQPPESSSVSSNEDSGKEDITRKSEGEVAAIFYAFLDVLLQCSNFPDAVTRVCLPIVERTGTWELFNLEVILGKSYPMPSWLSALQSCLMPLLNRIVKCGVKVLISREKESPTIPPLVARQGILPCGCPPSPQSTEDRKSKEPGSSVHELVAFTIPSGETESGSKDIMAEAIYSVIVQLVEDMYTLPTPVTMLFRALQDNISQKDVQAPHDCAGLKIMATYLRSVLLSCEQVETVMGFKMEDNTQDACKMLAECTYHVLTATSYGKGSGIPRIAGLFLKANRNWVMEQVELVTDYFGNDLFDLPETNIFEDSTADFNDNFLVAESTAILNSASGSTSLARIYNFVMNNMDWVEEQLDIPPLIGRHASPQKSCINLKLTTKPMAHVNINNPLSYFNTIGNHVFDHKLICEFDYDWASLLQSDLGLTEINFRYLLFHRHEMQEGAYLEENEKRPVDSLKRKFNKE